MCPNKETLDEFIRLYEAEFHETPTEAEAREMWTRVMDLYLLLYRKPTREESVTGPETTIRLA